MSLRDTLTNEKLGEKYKNSFSLVNHAIGLARLRIEQGDEMGSHLATDVLEFIADQEEDDVEEKVDNNELV
ncbi:MAG: hypothetical protein S4CHLAM45_02380 [Chlamydiales bacterium]|nr:hypothetical protein [Chlamydiales bacterium]MCH9619097.1 hypothetical protein [Chlamydiales bacterium]MCH9622359.1 hypothetical protein [Chlamydiales bacterium]